MRRAEVNEILVGVWWVILLRGILALILGIYAFLRPEWTIVFIVQIMGVFFLIDGILMTVGAVTGHIGRSRLLSLLGGIFYVIAALIIFGNPLLSAFFTQTLIIYIAAIFCCANGITKIITAARLWSVLGSRWAVLIDGLISVVFAVVLFTAPVVSGIVLMKIAGFFAVILAVSSLIFTFLLRKMA